MEEKEVLNYLRCFNIHSEELNKKSKEIVNELFEYIKKRKIDVSRKTDYEYLENVLRQLFESEMSYYSFDDKVEFIIRDERSSLGEFNYDRKLVDDKIVDSFNIFITFDSITIDGLCYELKNRLTSLSYLLKSLIHEIYHYRQFKLLTSNICSIDNLSFAKEYLLSDEGFFTNFYNVHHDDFKIESDANYNAYQRLIDILDYGCIFDIKRCSVEQARFLSKELRVNGTIKKDRDIVINEFVNDILKNKNNLFLLKKFPILMREYDENGESKTISVLISDMYRELSNIQKLNISKIDKDKLINDTLDMYYVLIYRRLEKNNIDEINKAIKIIGEINFDNLLNNIKEYYRKDRIRKSLVFQRKADIKLNLDSELNYLDRTDNYNSRIEYVSNNGMKKYYDSEEYIVKFIRLNTSDEKVIELITKYVLPRIPSCGYYLLHNGSKMLPNDFINSIIINEIGDCESLHDVIDLLKKYVKSTAKSDLQNELENINANYQEKVSYLDRIKELYIEKEGEMKL